MEPIDEQGELAEKIESAPAEATVELERLVRQIQAEGAEQSRRLELIKLAHSGQEASELEHKKMARQSAMAMDRLLEELVRTLQPILFSFAMDIADTPAEAAEISVQALDRIVERIHSFAWQSPFPAWCHGFVRLGWKARLRAILRYRARKKNIEQMAEIDGELAQGFGGTVSPSPFQIAATREEFKRMRSLLSSLPRDCWKRLLWVAVSGLRLKEVASRLNEVEEKAKD